MTIVVDLEPDNRTRGNRITTHMHQLVWKIYPKVSIFAGFRASDYLVMNFVSPCARNNASPQLDYSSRRNAPWVLHVVLYWVTG